MATKKPPKRSVTVSGPQEEIEQRWKGLAFLDGVDVDVSLRSARGGAATEIHVTLGNGESRTAPMRAIGTIVDKARGRMTGAALAERLETQGDRWFRSYPAEGDARPARAVLLPGSVRLPAGASFQEVWKVSVGAWPQRAEDGARLMVSCAHMVAQMKFTRRTSEAVDGFLRTLVRAVVGGPPRG